MNRRQFLTTSAAPAVLGRKGAAAARKRPNIVFIYTDDQRWDAIRAIGRQPWLRTPDMDRLMREGAWFRNAFVTTSLCSPSRSSLLTGCYPHKTGVIDNNRGSRLHDSVPVLFPALRQAGYSTAYVGKVHVPNFLEGDRGLDFVASFPAQGTYLNNRFVVNGKDTPTQGYITDRINDYMMDFVQKRDRGKPFCMFVGHKAVHDNFVPDPKYARLFENEWMPLPKTWDDPYENKPAYLKIRHDSWHGLKGLTSKFNYSDWQRRVAACLMSVDDGIGRLLAHLQETGELEDTVFIYSSDNGFFAGEHGLQDKRAMYEDSIRVPWLVRYPRMIRPGRTFDQMILNIDLAPTIFDLAGIDRPSYMQGRSWKPVLEGKDPEGRSAWLYEYFWEKSYPFDPTQFGVRTKRHKYIRYPDTGNTDPAYPMKPGEVPCDELYDLERDPLEMRNLAGDPASAGLLREMQALLAKLMQETAYPGGFR